MNLQFLSCYAVALALWFWADIFSITFELFRSYLCTAFGLFSIRITAVESNQKEEEERQQLHDTTAPLLAIAVVLPSANADASLSLTHKNHWLDVSLNMTTKWRLLMSSWRAQRPRSKNEWHYWFSFWYLHFIIYLSLNIFVFEKITDLRVQHNQKLYYLDLQLWGSFKRLFPCSFYLG